MKKILTIVFLIAFILTGCSLSQDNPKQAVEGLKINNPETNKIRLANLPIINSLPVYLAIEKKYFQEAGLEVEYIKMDSPNQIIDALISGNIDMTSPSGAMGIAGVANYKNPNKLKIYSAAGGNDFVIDNAILVKNNSEIKNIQDLEGKKLGFLIGIQWRTIARQILAQNNLKLDEDVMAVELAPNLQAQALASGQIDALLALEPIITIVKEKNIGHELAQNPMALYIASPSYPGAGIVNADFAKNNPNTTKKVIEIISKANKEIRENPNEARQYLKGYTALNDDLINKVPLPLIKTYDEFEQTDIDAIQKFYDIFTTYGVVDGKIDVQNIIYSPQ